MAFAIKAEVADRRAVTFAFIARQTPRVSVTIRRTALAKRTLGHRVGISDKAASFLSKCF